MLLNAVMALALKNGRNRESVARSLKVMEHEWVVSSRCEELARYITRRGLTEVGYSGWPTNAGISTKLRALGSQVVGALA